MPDREPVYSDKMCPCTRKLVGGVINSNGNEWVECTGCGGREIVEEVLQGAGRSVLKMVTSDIIRRCPYRLSIERPSTW